MTALENLCHLVVSNLTLYQNEVLSSTIHRGSTTFPLSVVHALYKVSEFFSPAVYKSDLYDDAMICATCRLYPLYRPCSRSSKKKTSRTFSRMCLQCFISKGIESRPDTVHTYVSKWLVTQDHLVECKCHRNTLLLLFPAFVLFASESSLKLLMREQLMDIVSAYHRAKSNVPSSSPFPINTTSRTTVAAYHDERREHADAHYLHSMIVNCLADHFMLCTGPCVYMRMTLRMCGASSRTTQFFSLLTSVIGTSDAVHPPQPFYKDTAGTRRNEGELYIERLQFYIQETRKYLQHTTSSPPPKCYCPSCSCHIDMLLLHLPQLSRLDNLTEISRRLGAYSVSHYDSFAPSSGADIRQPRKKKIKHLTLESITIDSDGDDD